MLNRLLLAGLIATLAIANAEEAPVFTEKTIALEIDQIKRQIEDEEKLWAEEKAREEESEKRRKERMTELESEKIALRSSVSQLEGDIQSTVRKIEGLKNKKVGLEARIKVLGDAVLAQVEPFEKEIAKTIPYQYEQRISGVKLVGLDLRQDKISPEEGFSRLMASYRKELQMASDAELYSGDVELQSGEKVSVKYIRVGKQFLAYSSPTGAHVGVLRRKSPGVWEWVREDQLDFDSRQALRDAIATSEGKAVPGFVEIPFWASDFAMDSGEMPASPVAETKAEEIKQ